MREPDTAVSGRTLFLLAFLAAGLAGAGFYFKVQQGSGTKRETVARDSTSAVAVACPPGSRMDARGVCAPLVDTSCPAGMRFVSGRGCVAELPAAPAAPAITLGAGSASLPPTRLERGATEYDPTAPAATDARRTLSPRDVSQAVARQRSTLKARCWDPAAARVALRGGPSTAQLTLRITISPAGRVTAVEVAGGEAFPGLAACIGAAARGWVFPEAEEKTMVTLPLYFTSE